MEKFERSDLKIESLSGTERVVQNLHVGVMVCYHVTIHVVVKKVFVPTWFLNSMQTKY